MTWEEIVAKDAFILSLFQEAGAYHVVNIKTGQPCRTFSAERAGDTSLYKPNPNFCKIQLWRGIPGDKGNVGLLPLMCQRVGWGRPAEAGYPELGGTEAYDICYHKILGAIRRCQHDEASGCKWDYPQPTEILPCSTCGSTTPGADVQDSPEMTAWTCQCGARRESLKRQRRGGFGSLLDRFAHKLAELQAKEEGAPPPPPLELIDGDALMPDDLAWPVFIVRSEADARQLVTDLKYRERLDAGGISRWYAFNSVYICDKAARKELLSASLKRETLRGAISWKPVVLTFTDEDLERKLSSVCTQVVTYEGHREKSGALSFDLEEIRHAIKDIAPAAQRLIQDMPEEVLDGWLGEVCRKYMAGLPRAYAWPSLLSAGSATMPPMGRIRVNLFTGLIGPVGTGKTSTPERAFWLLNVTQPTLMNLKSGSPEGMAEMIGNVMGAPRLVFVNELAHLMSKVNYEGSTFEQFLNDAYYQDEQMLTVARRKQIVFNCRLSLCGGLPEEKFEELFGAGTVGGFHNRMIFGVCPTNPEPFPWRPLDEPSPLLLELASTATLSSEENPFGEAETMMRRPQPIVVHPAVWAEKTRWEKELGLSGRAAESGIRAAIICAAYDCRGELKASELGPALAFARYQDDVHKRFEPNPGKTNEGILAHKARTYLNLHCPDGERWIGRREMLTNINGYDFGASVALRALQALEAAGEIEQIKVGRQWLVRRNPSKKETEK